jgi:hypothetical protein
MVLVILVIGFAADFVRYINPIFIEMLTLPVGPVTVSPIKRRKERKKKRRKNKLKRPSCHNKKLKHRKGKKK